MARPTRRFPRRSIWQRIKRLFGMRPEPPSFPPDLPDEDDALVRVGPPRAPRPAGAVALDLPEPPENVDARGRVPD